MRCDVPSCHVENRWHCTWHVTAYPATHFYRLTQSYLSVPLVCGGNDLEDESL